MTSEVRQAFDIRAETYDRSAMHQALASAVASFIDVAEVRDVLDVATGTGLLLRALPSGLNLSGADISPGMLEVARRELPHATLVEADSAALPFDPSSFDLVTCVSAIHYLDLPASLAEWTRILRPGGRVVLTAFRANGITARVLLRRAAALHGIGLEDSNAPTGSEEALESLASDAGLRVTRSSTWTFPAQRPDPAEEMSFAKPGSTTALGSADAEIRKRVLESLRELIDGTDRFEYEAIIAELG